MKEGNIKWIKRHCKKLYKTTVVLLADHMLPLTFIVGEEMEFGRQDLLNNSEPGNMLRDILTENAKRLLVCKIVVKLQTY